jgi:hypothetical protein
MLYIGSYIVCPVLLAGDRPPAHDVDKVNAPSVALRKYFVKLFTFSRVDPHFAAGIVDKQSACSVWLRGTRRSLGGSF